MKLQCKQLDVETSGVQVTGRASIELNSQMIEMLSSKIYSDKVRAVIREISTNAMDSHIDAGKPDVPFIVHLPNSFEPWFSVRDNGTGMTDEMVNKLYLTYGGSNRRVSDDFIGGLGLGSKSPFCYTDSFTVISRYNGVMTTFNLHLDAEGVPCPALVSKEETTEENGVEVRLLVDKADFNEFYTKAISVLSHFKVRPIVEGRGDFYFEDHEYLLQSDFYRFRCNNDSGYNNARVIMGNVAYSLDPQQLDIEYDLKNFLCYNYVDLLLPIGSVKFQPSREALSYDKKTKAYLTEVVKKIAPDVIRQITDIIAKCETVWSARLEIIRFQRLIRNTYFFTDPISWRGQQLSGVIDAPPNVILHVVKKDTKNGVSRLTKENRRSFNVADYGTRIYYDDLDGLGAYARLRYNLDNGQSAVLIQSEENIQDWLDETGISEAMKKVSGLAIPPRAPRVKTNRQRAKAWLLNDGGGRNCMIHWENADIDITTPGTYVVVKHGKYRELDGSFTYPGFVKERLRDLQAFGVTVELFGIRESAEEKFKKAGWVNLFDCAKSVVNNNINLKKEIEKGVPTLGYYHQKYLDNKFQAIEGPFGDYCREVKEVSKYMDKSGENWRQFCALYNWVSGKSLTINNDGGTYLNKLWKELQDEYPLLEWIQVSNGCKSFRDAIEAYTGGKKSSFTLKTAI